MFDNVRAILFDLDGTLLSTSKQAPGEMRGSLAFLRFLVPGGDVPRFLRHLWMATEAPSNYLLASIERLGVNSDLLGLVDRVRRLKGLGTKDRSQLLPGTAEMLAALKPRYGLALVTGRSRRAAAHFLQEYKLSDFFGVVTTRQDTWLLKPHPAPIRRTARLLGLPSGACLMVGDTPMDMRAAKSAGAVAVGVLSGFSELGELRQAGADFVLERAADLLIHLT